MRKWLQKFLGIKKLTEEREKTNKFSADILSELRRNSDLVERYNKAYHI